MLVMMMVIGYNLFFGQRANQAPPDLDMLKAVFREGVQNSQRQPAPQSAPDFQTSLLKRAAAEFRQSKPEGMDVERLVADAQAESGSNLVTAAIIPKKLVAVTEMFPPIGAPITYTISEQSLGALLFAEQFRTGFQVFGKPDAHKAIAVGDELVMLLNSRIAEPEHPDALFDSPTAVTLMLAVLKRDVNTSDNNYREVLSEWQTFHNLSKDPRPWVSQEAARQLEPTTVAVARLSKDFSQHPFIATGYHFVDFLVRMTGSVGWFSYWFAMLVLAIAVRTIAWPLAVKQYIGFKRMALLQPMMKELQSKYQGQELQTRTMKLYQKYGINPMAGCLPAIIQIPFFLWIYQCVYAYQPEFLKGTFLWINPAMHKMSSMFGASMGERDVPIIILYGISMIITTMLTPTDPTHGRQAKMMGLLMAVMFSTMMFFWPLPSAFIIYWVCVNVVATAQNLRFAKLPIPPLEEVQGGGKNGFFKLLAPQEGPSGQPAPIKTSTKTGAPVLHKSKSGKQPKKRKK